jgi:hypothetical protein
MRADSEQMSVHVLCANFGASQCAMNEKVDEVGDGTARPPELFAASLDWSSHLLMMSSKFSEPQQTSTVNYTYSSLRNISLLYYNH